MSLSHDWRIVVIQISSINGAMYVCFCVLSHFASKDERAFCGAERGREYHRLPIRF